MRFLFLFTVSSIFLSYSAIADPAKEGKIKRTCRIIFPERPNDSPKIAYLFDGKKSEMIPLPSMNFSPVISLPLGELTLLLTNSPINDPENLPLGVPRLKIPEDVRDFYILVSPDRENKKLPVKMKMVNVSDGKLKSGETLWFNATDHLIAAKLGKARLLIAPKSTKVSQSPVSKSGHYRAEFGYKRLGEGKLYRITEQYWWHDVNSRHVGFMVNTGGRLPKIYYYRDFRAKIAPEKVGNVE